VLKLPEIPSVLAPKSAQDHGNPFKMPSEVQVFSMRENDRIAKRQEKQKLNGKSIYEKHTVKGKNFKTLLAEDEDDIKFYQNVKKRDADTVMLTRQTRGMNGSSSGSTFK
jgi:hypothetical protein